METAGKVFPPLPGCSLRALLKPGENLPEMAKDLARKLLKCLRRNEMNTRNLLIVFMIVVVIGTAAAVGPGSGGDHDAVLASIPAEPLNPAERDALIFMAEEEKLARDVYLTLAELWDIPVFTNIAEAEQQHIDSVGSLLERYDIPVPGTIGVPGTFENQDLQALYDALIARGSESIEAALIAGATIEDTDIADLHERLEDVDNADIRMIFENLIAGSENHMRAFVGQLERHGAEYAPQFIDDEYYREILAGQQGGPRQSAAAGRSRRRFSGQRNVTGRNGERGSWR
jgi:hypothetical protein